ncbi:MAG TPA: DegT/DnrJ/EryC1/StrS family aminotransferase [Solirubrobacterales bacterium]|nr:DegT/DnrJ/EryC1/StrS family aminotransferase [Solirubrobacterales bacterium]
MSQQIPFVDLGAARDALGGGLEEAVARVLASGWYLLGEELERFEAEFAAYCGTDHCVGVGSGLSALELSLRAAGIGPGDEVLVPAYTWIASWLAISNVGATPVGVEVEAETYNIDPAALAPALTERTAAIMPVHLRGEVAAMEKVMDFAAAHGLFVLEDAAQAHGARRDGKRAGSIGAAAGFSFYPSKNLGAVGDGGAVTTDDADLAERIRLLRNYGTRNRYAIEMAGVNSRLAEVQAAALRTELPHLDEWNGARASLAARYDAGFAGNPSIRTPRLPAGSEPVWHFYFVGLDDRDARRRELGERGVETLVHYPVLPHLSPAYADAGIARGTFPISERLADEVLSLPMHPFLSADDCDRVIAALLEVNSA